MFYNPNTGQFSIYLPDVTVMAERGTSHVIFSHGPKRLDLGEAHKIHRSKSDPTRWSVQIEHKTYQKKTFMRKMSSNHRIDFNFRRTEPKISRSPPGSAW